MPPRRTAPVADQLPACTTHGDRLVRVNVSLYKGVYAVTVSVPAEFRFTMTYP